MTTSDRIDKWAYEANAAAEPWNDADGAERTAQAAKSAAQVIWEDDSDGIKAASEKHHAAIARAEARKAAKAAPALKRAMRDYTVRVLYVEFGQSVTQDLSVRVYNAREAKDEVRRAGWHTILGAWPTETVPK